VKQCWRRAASKQAHTAKRTVQDPPSIQTSKQIVRIEASIKASKKLDRSMRDSSPRILLFSTLCYNSSIRLDSAASNSHLQRFSLPRPAPFLERGTDQIK
jgi:hypothetical protein